MPIKNYTTKVAASRSVQEIQEALVKHGATGVLYEYEQGTGRIQSLKFILVLEGNQIPFSLPIDWRRFQLALKKDRVTRWNDEDYCYRVAWRVIRDWVMAQLSIFETQMVSIPQLFLPYAVTRSGETLYEIAAKNPSQLFLPPTQND